MDRFVYMDNAATTQTDEAVLEAMLPYYSEYFGNPSGVYEFGTRNKSLIAEARAKLAGLINAEPGEIYFTGSGSEADNWVLKGLADSGRGRHIITTGFEHHAVLHTCEYLAERGFKITYIQPDELGRIDVGSIERAIRPDTMLISVMFANNEIGTIQPIAEIGKMARKHGVLFHSDAVQALGHEDIDVKAMNIDLLSASAHKLYGPKGVGMLYIGSGVVLPSFIHGGGQEQGRRAGTENVPAIVGFGKAAELALKHMTERREYEMHLRDYMIDRILSEIPYTRLNGTRKNRLSNNANFSFQFVEGETLLIMLDMKGIACSTGSACNASSSKPSHVLTSIGLSDELAHGSLRLTISYSTTKEEVDYVVDTIKQIVGELREMNFSYARLQHK